MCLGFGVATLVKGLVGVVVPGMVILCYLLLSKQWKAPRKIDVVSGALLFFSIVLPWYLMAEWRNPGYLHYYLWDEHFGRFVTNEFDRAEPWYYFIGVGLVGFLPWSLLLPLFARHAYKNGWQRKFDDKTLYLISWAVVPFLFFSISKSKLPHYILPIFPALAMLTAAAMVRVYQEAPGKMRFALSLTWWVQLLCSAYFLLGLSLPEILPRQIRFAVGAMSYFIWIYAALTAAILVYMTKRNPAGRFRSQRRAIRRSKSKSVLLSPLSREDGDPDLARAFCESHRRSDSAEAGGRCSGGPIRYVSCRTIFLFAERTAGLVNSS